MRMSKGVRLDVYLVRVVLPLTEVGGPAIRKQRDKIDSATLDCETTLLDLLFSFTPVS